MYFLWNIFVVNSLIFGVISKSRGGDIYERMYMYCATKHLGVNHC